MKNKILTKRKLKFRNIARIFGMFLSIYFIMCVTAILILFIIKVSDSFDSIDMLLMMICGAAFGYTFLHMIPNNYIISYKDYIKESDKK